MALACVGNIVAGPDDVTQQMLDCGVLPVLGAIVNNDDGEIHRQVAWALANIAAGSEAQIAAVLAADTVPWLVRSLQDNEFAVVREAAWALCNAVLGGTDDHVRRIVAAGAMPWLFPLLECDEMNTVLVVIEALENILRVGGLDEVNAYAEMIVQGGWLPCIRAAQDHPHQLVYKCAQAIMLVYFYDEDGGAVQVDPN